MSQACTEFASPNALATGHRRSGALRGDEPATIGRWSARAVWAALAALAITLGACESPSSLAPTTPAGLTISTQGRLERGASIQLQAMRDGSPVSGQQVSWTTGSATRVRLVSPDSAILTDTGDVSITAHVGIGNTTVVVHVAAPPTIVFAMHDVAANGSLGDYNVYRAFLDGQSLAQLTSGTSDNDEPTVANGVVVFTSYRDGYPALYRVSLNGGSESRLRWSHRLRVSGIAFRRWRTPRVHRARQWSRQAVYRGTRWQRRGPPHRELRIAERRGGQSGVGARQ